jgi:hypothetical protein
MSATPVFPQICGEPETATDCENVEGSVGMTSNALWRNMWSVASQYASDPALVTAQPWLEVCETIGICIFCDEFYTDVQSAPVYQTVADTTCTAAGAPTALCSSNGFSYVAADATTGCGDGVTGPSGNCLAAANLDFKAAVTTPGLTQTGGDLPLPTVPANPLTPSNGASPLPEGAAPSAGLAFDATEAAWAASLNSHGSKLKLKCADTGRTVDAVTGGMTGTAALPAESRCVQAESTYPFDGDLCIADATEALCVAGCVYTAVDGATPSSCVPTAGPMVVTAEDGAGWSDIIGNYTVQKGTAWLGLRTKCEMAVVQHTTVTDLSSCKGSGADVPASDAGTYMADCDACNSAIDFTFASGVGSSYCLSYFVGHYEDACASAGGSACRSEFTGFDGAGVATAINQADRTLHINYMVDRAYATDEKPDAGLAVAGTTPSSFCGYTDVACKAKIKETVEGSMQTIGVIGAIFIVFFLAIMFLTLQGIKIYKGGDGDDDDDDDDDDDSDE